MNGDKIRYATLEPAGRCTFTLVGFPKQTDRLPRNAGFIKPSDKRRGRPSDDFSSKDSFPAFLVTLIFVCIGMISPGLITVGWLDKTLIRYSIIIAKCSCAGCLGKLWFISTCGTSPTPPPVFLGPCLEDTGLVVFPCISQLLGSTLEPPSHVHACEKQSLSKKSNKA